MSIQGVLLLIIVVGVVLGAVNAFVPMAVPVKRLLNVVVVLGLVNDPSLKGGACH